MKYLFSILFIFFSNLVLSEELFLSCIATETKTEYEEDSDEEYRKITLDDEFHFMIDKKKIIIVDYDDVLQIRGSDLRNKIAKIQDTTETHRIYKMTENTCGIDPNTDFCGNLNLEFIINRNDFDLETIEYITETQNENGYDTNLDFFKSLKIFYRYKCLERTKRL